MSVDAAGNRRVGMFEQVIDTESGATFAATSGTGTKVTYGVTGGGATPDARLTTTNRRERAEYLTMDAVAKGVLPARDGNIWPAPQGWGSDY